jgi:hypothetical protein
MFNKGLDDNRKSGKMIFLNLLEKKIIIKLFNFATILIIIFSFSVDLGNTLQYGGVDLRTRVVGARLLTSGQDPYFFSWEKGLSDRFLDPLDKPNSEVSRVTVPPNVLTLCSIISSYSFFQQKIIWLIFQWGAFLSTLTVFLWKSNSPSKRRLILTLGLFFVNSCFWRLHVERGQIYIIYTLLFTVAWYLFSFPVKFSHLLSGIVIGFTASLRPPAILSIIPFILYRRFSIVLGITLGLILGFSMPLALSNTSIWTSYASASTQPTKYNYSAPENLSHYDSLDSDNLTHQEEKFYPSIIEGLENLTKTKDIPAVNSSFRYILSRFGVQNLQQTLIILMALSMFVYYLLFLKNREKNPTNEVILLNGMVLYLISEFFIPSPRYSYNDVQWILPVFIILDKVDIRNLLSDRLTVALLVGSLFSLGLWIWPSRFLLISVFLIMLYSVISSLRMLSKD